MTGDNKINARISRRIYQIEYESKMRKLNSAFLIASITADELCRSMNANTRLIDQGQSILTLEQKDRLINTGKI